MVAGPSRAGNRHGMTATNDRCDWVVWIRPGWMARERWREDLTKFAYSLSRHEIFFPKWLSIISAEIALTNHLRAGI